MPGAVLVTGSLMLGVYTIVGIPEEGWNSLQTLVLGAVSLALMAGFVARQHTAATPLVPLRIFRSRNVTGANVVQVLMVAGLFGMFFLGALYLQGIQGYSPIEVGLAYLPVALLIGAVSLWLADKLILRFGARRVLIAGLTLGAGRPAAVHAGAAGGHLRDRRPAHDGAVRRRRRPVVPGHGVAGHVRRHPGGRRPGLGPGEHHPAGGRRAGPGRAGHALDHPHRGPAGRRRLARRRPLVDGYQLAFFVGAGFAAAAIALAVTVLEPTPELEIEELPDVELEEGVEVGYREAA